MKKSDKSVHNICIASIKRSTMQPYDFKWTRFYETNSVFKSSFPAIEIDLPDNELVICSTFIDIDNFSVLTTQKLVTVSGGHYQSGSLDGAKNKLYGDFKGTIDKAPFTKGTVQLVNGVDLTYFIETGKASMIMINGVKTLLQIG